MKAIRVHAYGAPDTLVYEDVADPIAGPTDVIVEVEASGINPADYKFRNGLLAQIFPKALPFTLGMDVAGRIVGKGSAVGTHQLGQRVLAMLYLMGNGGYAERVAVPAEWCARMPAGLDPVTAAALPTPATTAVEWIEDDLRVSAGQKVLVTGATGWVGLIACFVAKKRGARVTAAVRREYLNTVSYADDAFALDGTGAPAERNFDCIADTVGGEVGQRLLGFLKPGGVLSSIANPVENAAGLDVVIRNFGNRPDPDRLARLATEASTGELKLPPIRRMRLSEAAEAHRQMEKGGAGKIVLIPDRLYK